MARPTVPDVAEQLYDELGVSQPADESLDWPFLILLAGIASAMGELPSIVRDTDDGPGWSAVLDPPRAPVWALPWLAQFAGVRLTPGLTDDEHRAEITSPPAFQRGTPAAMIATAARYLTGTKLVVFRERDGSAYRVSISTRTAETPDPAVVEAALRRQKPAGLILAYSVADGPTWPEPTSTWATATGTWQDAMSTVP
jgi:hypothetical protein